VFSACQNADALSPCQLLLSPQLDATEAADKNLAFLSGSTALEQGQLLLSYSREHHWNINAGAMHQVQAASEPPTQFELIGENRTVAAEKVLLHRCTAGGMEGHDKSAVYPVRMIPAPPERLRIAFALGSDEEGQKMLRQMISNKASQLYQLEAATDFLNQLETITQRSPATIGLPKTSTCRLNGRSPP